MRVVHHLANSRSQRCSGCSRRSGCRTRSGATSATPRRCARRPSSRVHPLGPARLLDETAHLRRERGDHRASRQRDRPVRRHRGTRGQSPFHMFLHYAEGSLMPPLLRYWSSGGSDCSAGPRASPCWRCSPIISRGSKASWQPQWFAGDSFSAADVMMSFPLEAARSRAGLDDRYPNIFAWLARIHARPAYSARSAPEDLMLTLDRRSLIGGALLAPAALTLGQRAFAATGAAAGDRPAERLRGSPRRSG